MASFVKRLQKLLAAARERDLLEEDVSAELLALAAEQDRAEHRFRGAAATFGWLGGAVAAAGIALLIAVNWAEIPGLTKVVGFIVLLASVHGLGAWLGWRKEAYPKTAHALHFMGAAVFVAGVGLVAQVYHIHEHPPNGVLLWLIAIAPLAYLLRSGPITVMSIFALLLWAHMEGAFKGSVLTMPEAFTPHLTLELAVAVALIGFGAALKNRERAIGKTMIGVGILLAAVILYFLGFFRHWWYGSLRLRQGTSIVKMVLPFSAALLGFFGLIAAACRSAWASLRLRVSGVLMLLALLLTGAAALAVDVDILPTGPKVVTWLFGWAKGYHVTALMVTFAAWVVWFALAGWCLAYGAAQGSKALVNVGVIAFGLGVVTRVFDLALGLAWSGWVLLVGGLALLGTGWAMERWRRRLLAGMEGSK